MVAEADEVNLTDRKLEEPQARSKLEDKLGHYDAWDAVVPGLGVRTSAKRDVEPLC